MTEGLYSHHNEREMRDRNFFFDRREKKRERGKVR